MNMHIVVVPDGKQNILNQLVFENRKPLLSLDYFPYAGTWYLDRYYVIYSSQTTHACFSEFRTLSLILDGKRLIYSYNRTGVLLFPCSLEDLLKNRTAMHLSLQELLDCWTIITSGKLLEPARIYRTAFVVKPDDITALEIPTNGLCFARTRQTTSLTVCMLITFNKPPRVKLNGKDIRMIYTYDTNDFVDTSTDESSNVTVVDTLSDDSLVNYIARCFLIEASFC